MQLTRSKIIAYFLFLLSPFLSLLFSLFNHKASWSKNIVWGFSVFYGFSFVISPISTADSTRYAGELSLMFTERWSLVDIFGRMYLIDGSLDLYQPLVTFFVSRFTDNYNILFSAYGFFFGYIYSRNIWILIDISDKKLDLNQKLIISAFAFIVSISAGINGVRFYTACHVFIHGCLLFFVKRNKSGLLLSIASFLFHWSFILAAFSIIIYFLIKNKLSIHFIFFLLIISFGLSILRSSFSITNFDSFFPFEVLTAKSTYYLERNSDFERLALEQSFFLTLYSWLSKLFFAIILFYLYFFQLSRIKNFEFYNFFIFVVIFFSMSNVFSLNHTAARFISVSYMLCSSFILLYSIKFIDVTLRKLLFLLSPILIFLLVIELRLFIDYVDFSIFYGNFFVNLFLEKGVPLGERF